MNTLIVVLFLSIIVNCCYSQDLYKDSIKLSNDKVIFLENGSLLSNCTNSNDSLIINQFKYDNYPNPFSPPSPIEFAFYKKSKVRLLFYDRYENLIKTIVWDNLTPGRYRFSYWNFSLGLPEGHYICNVEITYLKKEGILIK